MADASPGVPISDRLLFLILELGLSCGPSVAGKLSLLSRASLRWGFCLPASSHSLCASGEKP